MIKYAWLVVMGENWRCGWTVGIGGGGIGVYVAVINIEMDLVDGVTYRFAEYRDD